LEPKKAGADCANCPLKEQVLVEPRWVLSPTNVDLLVVGEAPGKMELKLGKPFVGPSGSLLQRVLDPLMGGKSMWVTNAALCYDSFGVDTKTPVVHAARCCLGRLKQEINDVNPKVIILLGNTPTQLLLSTKEGITSIRGKVHILDGYTVIPTLHPAAILRNPGNYQDFRSDIARAVAAISMPAQVAPTEVPFELTSDYVKVFKAAEEAPFAVLDLETTGLDASRDHIIAWVIATEQQVFVMPEAVKNEPGFIEALRNSRVKYSGHNSKFDRNFILSEFGIPIHFSFDSMTSHYLLDERSGAQGLKVICDSLFGAPEWDAELDVTLKKLKTTNYDNLPKEMLYKYAAQDGYYTAKLTRTMSNKLRAYPKLLDVMLKIMVPASEAFSNAETRGVLFDVQGCEALRPVYAAKCAELETKMHELVGIPFNPRSPAQTAHALYDIMHLEPVSDELSRSTDTKAVMIKRRGVPIVDLLVEYRMNYTILSRYIEGMLNAVGGDGRIHTSFKLHGTVTGRLSSSPNLQNIPRRDKTIKNLFLASPGYTLLYADFSQLELRCIGWLSNDPFLLDGYRLGMDLHAEMAKVLFGEKFSKEQRELAKRCNFGLAYGRSVNAMANDGLVILTRQEAERIQRTFFERMPKVTQWMQEVRDLINVQQYVESPLGRRRRFPILPSGRFELEEVYRQGINFIPQSMAADLTTYAFIKMDQAGLHPLLSVHDAILAEVPTDQAETAHRQMLEIMIECGKELYGDKIIFAAEGGIGQRWGEI
jgi:DNA polymerase-1